MFQQLLSLFRKPLNGELREAEQLGKEKGQQLAAAFLQGFESSSEQVFSQWRAKHLLPDQQERTDQSDSPAIDVEFEEKEQIDYSSWSRPELMKKAKELRLEGYPIKISPKDSKDEIIDQIRTALSAGKSS